MRISLGGYHWVGNRGSRRQAHIGDAQNEGIRNQGTCPNGAEEIRQNGKETYLRGNKETFIAA